MSCIYFKFRSDRKFDSVTFRGDTCTLSELRHLVIVKKGLVRYTSDFDLIIYDAQTNEVYGNSNDVIRCNSSVIISRVPAHGEQKPMLPQPDKMPTLSDMLTKAIENPNLYRTTTAAQKPRKPCSDGFSADASSSRKRRAAREDFKCTLCDKVMVDAVMTTCCCTNYCAQCIDKHLQSADNSCPACKQSSSSSSLNSKRFVTNKPLRNEINEFLKESTNNIKDATTKATNGHPSATIPVVTTTAASTAPENASGFDYKIFLTTFVREFHNHRHPSCINDISTPPPPPISAQQPTPNALPFPPIQIKRLMTNEEFEIAKRIVNVSKQNRKPNRNRRHSRRRYNSRGRRRNE